MLAFFRNNQFTTAVTLALYVGLLHLPALAGWVPMPTPAKGAAGLAFGDLFGSIAGDARWSAVAATILVYIQALLVNKLADTFRLMNDRNWIPGVLYALVASCLPDFLFLTSPLVAVTFVPLALMRTFRVYKQTQAYGDVFDAAFWIALAALFHPAATWLLVTTFIGILILRSFPAREQIAFFTGILVPAFLAFTLYFWFDRGGEFVNTQFTQWISAPGTFFTNDLHTYLKTGLMAVLLVVVLTGFNVYYYKKLIQVQKFITIFYWFLFAGLIAAVLQPEMHTEYFILLMPSMAIFLSYSIQALRNLFMAEVFHFVLLAAAFFIQLFPNHS